MRRFEGPTRYLGDQSGNLALFRNKADRYPQKLTPDESLGFWQKPFDWNQYHPSYFNQMYQALNAIRVMRLDPRSCIVEVGSGAGWLSRILAGLGYCVECIEPCETMIDIARQNVAEFLRLHRMDSLIPNVRFHRTTLEECELSDQIADAILLFESCHHLADECRAMRQAHRLLKPGGVLCVAGEGAWIPGHVEQAACYDAAIRQFDTLESPFTPEYLTHVLELAGFEQVTRHYGINGWYSSDYGKAPIQELAQSNLIDSNNITARRPLENL
jgi:SAM-dependent methyltransferase